MSKKKNPSKAEQPGYVVELLDKGTVTLQAKTREELAEQIDNIHAEVRYAVGAEGKDRETGLFSLRLDLVTND